MWSLFRMWCGARGGETPLKPRALGVLVLAIAHVEKRVSPRQLIVG